MNYIVYVSNIIKQEYETLNDLFINIFGKEYFELNTKDKFIKRFNMAKSQKILEKSTFPIVNTLMGILDPKDSKENYSLDKSIIIDNEITFLCAMCLLNQITLFEKSGHNELVSKSLDEKYSQNEYVKVNNPEILNDILKNNVRSGDVSKNGH